jgi:hypothetical protein
MAGLFGSPGLWVGRDGILQQYPFTLTYLVAQFVFIRWRRGRPRVLRGVRPASDPTWFLSVYVWGIESVIRTANAFAGDGWAMFVMPSGQLMLTIALVGSLLAESLARKAGCGARPSGGAVPTGVVAAILTMQLAWTMSLYAPRI